MKMRYVPALATATLAAAASSVFGGGTSFTLDFNGSGSTLGATGFENVYTIDPAFFNVTGGRLVMMTPTVPSDSFGQYENDPDTARNMFYNEMQPLQRTVVEARVRVENLNVNFHGGGIWMGTDQDHYIRLGVLNNSNEGGVAVETLRENQDFWPGNVPPGPGNDIQDEYVQGLQTSPQTTPIDIVLRLIRDGTGAGPSGAGGSAFFSIDNGATFTRVPNVPGFTLDGVVTGPGQGPNGGTSIEGNFKVGVYANGDSGQIPATFSFDSLSANSGDTAWANDTSGDYEVWNNWTLGVPSAVEATANFPNVITVNRTINVTDPAGHNLGTLNLNAGAGIGYTIAPGVPGSESPLRFVRFGGQQASINVAGGNHEITTAVNYANNTTWNVASGARLRLLGNSTFENAAVLTKTGAGLVETNVIRAGGLAVNGGTVRVLPNGTSAATSNVGSLSVTNGQLDLTNNAMVIAYSPNPTPIASVRAALLTGYNNGSWDGNGIITSSGDAGNFGLGYAEASQIPSIPAIFGTVTGDAVLIRFTRFGDADLNGMVNLADFNRLASNFGQSDRFWHQGDFNYDGTVNLADFNRLAANFGLSAAGPEVTPQDWANLAAAVPEPVALAPAALLATLASRRRRRRG